MITPIDKEIKKKRYVGISNFNLKGHKFKNNSSLFEIPKDIRRTINSSNKSLFTNLKNITDL